MIYLNLNPGDRFRVYGGRVAHVDHPRKRGYGRFAVCGVSVAPAYAHPADDRPLCKECARAMERNDR